MAIGGNWAQGPKLRGKVFVREKGNWAYGSNLRGKVFVREKGNWAHGSNLRGKVFMREKGNRAQGPNLWEVAPTFSILIYFATSALWIPSQAYLRGIG
ncbi:hypothetical protein KSZ_38600 [Dictyobacter formicarum]|uniref:Uncharacterized protein n=1 Tax=Dictyobacter formicarum TaxID=2778368 RepID=A0ABQ3VJJ6_9CHLR|nr:hypothetical protein KSZ_38600 [Dictyobacter formicarum]